MEIFYWDKVALEALNNNDTKTLWGIYGAMMYEGGTGTPLVPVSTEMGQVIINKLMENKNDRLN